MRKDLLIANYYASLKGTEKIQQAIDQEILEEVVRLIEEDQLDSGIDADGDIIGTYSIATEIITEGEKRAGEPFNLLDTGEFRDSITAKLVSSGNDFFIEIDADPLKEGGDDLFKLYGSRIINLTDENLGFLVRQIRDNVIQILRKRR